MSRRRCTIRSRAPALLADLCRINTLYMIMQAGSGHIGSSFSSTDLITWLWTEELRDPNSGSRGADVYFSSKGHDAPALYSLLIALEKLDFDLLPQLRRLDGLPGHPDVGTPFIATNTGSLGMGISKAYGMARAQSLHRPRRPHRRDDRRRRAAGRADLGVAAAGGQRTARRDHRDRRSQQAAVGLGGVGGQRPRPDRGQVPRVRLGSAARRRPRLRACCATRLAHFATVTDRPKVFIADTIKGKGVSFMEGLACGDQTYHFHAGAPSLKDYLAATREMVARVNGALDGAGPAARAR